MLNTEKTPHKRSEVSVAIESSPLTKRFKPPLSQKPPNQSEFLVGRSSKSSDSLYYPRASPKNSHSNTIFNYTFTAEEIRAKQHEFFKGIKRNYSSARNRLIDQSKVNREVNVQYRPKLPADFLHVRRTASRNLQNIREEKTDTAPQHYESVRNQRFAIGENEVETLFTDNDDFSFQSTQKIRPVSSLTNEEDQFNRTPITSPSLLKISDFNPEADLSGSSTIGERSQRSTSPELFDSIPDSDSKISSLGTFPFQKHQNSDSARSATAGPDISCPKDLGKSLQNDDLEVIDLVSTSSQETMLLMCGQGLPAHTASEQGDSDGGVIEKVFNSPLRSSSKPHDQLNEQLLNVERFKLNSLGYESDGSLNEIAADENDDINLHFPGERHSPIEGFTSLHELKKSGRSEADLYFKQLDVTEKQTKSVGNKDKRTTSKRTTRARGGKYTSASLKKGGSATIQGSGVRKMATKEWMIPKDPKQSTHIRNFDTVNPKGLSKSSVPAYNHYADAPEFELSELESVGGWELQRGRKFF
ncbi:hypothetical protein HK098_003210 [Nowakowskiella sp. JEL0407]|nr:hypothetical protein HK098_003210 [Nowakowskiella sp. JEL0407]